MTERNKDMREVVMTSGKAIAEFKAALQQGIDGIVKASEIYVKALDENPKAGDVFRENLGDMVPASAWAQFEAVGRKWMHPRLLLGGVSDPKKASRIKRLPYSLQERVFNRERFTILTQGGDRMEIDMLEGTAEQVEQLCNGTSIRNVSEQKAWIESRKAAVPADEVEPLPYTVTDGRVSFRRGCVMNRAEVKRLLQEM